MSTPAAYQRCAPGFEAGNVRGHDLITFWEGCRAVAPEGARVLQPPNGVEIPDKPWFSALMVAGVRASGVRSKCFLYTGWDPLDTVDYNRPGFKKETADEISFSL